MIITFPIYPIPMRQQRSPIPFGYILLFGIAIGLILSIRTYIPYIYWGKEENYIWQQQALPHLINYILWPFLVPLISYFARRYPLDRATAPVSFLAAILASILVALLHEVISNSLYWIAVQVFPNFNVKRNLFDFFWGAFPSALISRIFEYWIILGVFMTLRYYQKLKNKELELAQLENKLSNAKLKALQMQLHPHFLFNALNSISSLVEIDPPTSQKMISKLGQLLRTMLDQKQEPFIPFTKELDYIKNYLDIEQIRFQDRLQVNYQIDNRSLSIPIPNLLLQPLVENAIKHGFSKKVEGGLIQIKSTVINNKLKIEVEDDGVGLNNNQIKSLEHTHIGLKNTKERLFQLYGTEHEFYIESKKNVGFKVTLVIPITLN